MPPAERDPNAVALLEAWPAPNTGAGQYRASQPNPQRTRQEVLRLDWNISAGWRLMARYTHDLSRTTEAGGLFFGTAIPDVARTTTEVPGQLFVAQLTTALGSRTLNELSLQVSGNDIESEYGEGVRNRREEYGSGDPGAVPREPRRAHPHRRDRRAVVGGGQPSSSRTATGTTRSPTTSPASGAATPSRRGCSSPSRRRTSAPRAPPRAASASPPGAAGPRSRTSSPATRAPLCGASCAYAEPESEIFSQLRYRRYELFVQDSWRARPGLTLDLGLRYAVYPGRHRPERRPHELRARALRPRRRPRLVRPGRGHPRRGERRLHERDHRGGPLVTLRPPRPRHGLGRRPAPPRGLLGPRQRLEDDGPRRVRGLPRSAPGGRLPPERGDEPAVRHEPHRPQPAPLLSRGGHEPDGGAPGGARRDRRRLRAAPHAAVERGRRAAALPARGPRRLVSRLQGLPPHPAGGRERGAAARTWSRAAAC